MDDRPGGMVVELKRSAEVSLRSYADDCNLINYY